MNRPQEQITESGYLKDTKYWSEWAKDNGGLEICDDETGEVIATIGG